MLDLPTIRLAWALLGLYLVMALVLHERTGMHLGGILVLPLLLLYGIMDLVALVVFAFATAMSYTVGALVMRRVEVHGRRALGMHLAVGVAATLIATRFAGLPLAGFLLALLPGLYAYNLQREGTRSAVTTGFMTGFGVLLGLVIVGVRLIPAAGEWVVPFAGAGAFVPFHADALLALGVLVVAVLQGMLDERAVGKRWMDGI